MNKMKKLLSVILAVVLAFSALSVLGSAAVAQYKTVEDLEKLDAYSAYGAVTRLSTEERASIVQDFLDSVLPGLGINMGEVFNVLGLSITLDLSSVDRLCYSLDTVKNTMSNWLFGIAAGIVNLGILEQLEMGTWNTGIDRAGDSQLTLFAELFELLSNNKTLVYNVINSGTLDLGIVGGLIGGGLDLSAVTDIIGDLPGLLKGLIFGLFERVDDTTAEVQAYDNAATGDGKIQGVLNTFVKNLFTKNNSMQTIKLDANGNVISDHNLPSEPGYRYYYVKSADGQTLTSYRYIDAKEAKDSQKTDTPLTKYTYVEDSVYELKQEVEGYADSDYVWVGTDAAGNTGSLKYYANDTRILPSFNASIDLETMSAADLLYTFIPSVFEDLAVVVLNGSLKKILGDFFNAEYNYVGVVGSDAVNALGNDEIFTAPQGEYAFEWSDYAVIGGNHYYRYLDDIYMADLSAVNSYFHMINWDYEITGDFMNQFVPENGGSTSDTLFMQLNNFLIKVANTVLTEETLAKMTLVNGGNDLLVDNLKSLAQAIIQIEPEAIFGSDYLENSYYNLLIAEDNQTILTGIAAQLVDALMPQMILPNAADLMAQNTAVGAILVTVIRELATQLVPQNNYDALIFADYGTSTSDKVKTYLAGKDNSYWLDVALTIGVDIGIEYLHNLADMGGDTAYLNANAGWKSGATWAAGTSQADLNAYWEGLLDYVIDWALSDDYEWTWKFEKMVDTTGLTIDLATAQDPWVKLDKILNDLLPADEILNITATDCETELEQALRYDLILSLLNGEWDNTLGLIIVPDGALRADNVFQQLATLLKGILNGLLKKIGGGSYNLIPTNVNTFDQLLTQSNIAVLARDLVGALYTAYQNGLLDVVLPILNFFIGWKTDPQVYADPQIWATYRDGGDYMYVYGNKIEQTTIYFLNNSSGMLEKHRGTDVTDHAYEIQIVSIEEDAAQTTLTFNYGDGVVSPYEQLAINVGGTYVTEEPVTITIGYEYVGKNGQPIGDTYYATITTLISNQYEDANVEGRKSGDDADGNYGIDPYKSYQFTEENIYDVVTSFRPSVWGTNPTIGGGTSNFHWVVAPAGDDLGIDCDKNQTGNTNPIGMTGLAAEYFAYYQGQNGGWGNSFPKDGSTSGKLYYAKDGVTAETEFPYGLYDMGQVAIAYSDDVKFWKIDYIYYNDYDVYDMYTEYTGKGITKYDVNRNDAAAVAAYDAYNNAFKEVARLALYPMMTEGAGHASTDYVKVIMPQIEPAKAALEAAYEALVPFLEAAEGSSVGAAADVAPIEAVLDAEVPEINYQDYDLYEYFAYQDVRTEARNVVASYYAPALMDQYYIMGSGISEAELNSVIAAEGNEFIAAGITASRMENDPAAVAAAKDAHDNFEAPVNAALYLDDLASRLAYYKQFVIKEEAQKQFLEKEIAYAEAQEYVADDYTPASWANYEAAYNNAKAVMAGSAENADLNSVVFSAKYNLMLAQKELLKKADSLIEAGGTADLLANIDIANEIFASLAAGDGAWTLKDDVDADAAYAALISALGYKYVGNDGNTWNLYAGSALEYAENDRPNVEAQQTKVDNANAALAAAIENFQKAEEPDPEPVAPVLSGVGTGVVDADNKYVYGVVAGTEDFSEFFAVENGSFTVDGVGTGATLSVLDESGTVVDTYTLIIFGDVNGDGAVTSADCGIAKNASLGATIEGDAYTFAADVNGDGSVTAADCGIIKNASLGADLTVNPYAA